METVTINTAINSETKFAELEGRAIAYRIFGEGKPIILCNRFRGTLDTWDPLFLDELAESFKVIIFDYSGIGFSTGLLPTDIRDVAKDVKDLADFLDIDKAIILGWSYGGFVAQTAIFQFPELATSAILLGTNPPGKNEIALEEEFFKAALKPLNDFDDEVVLFFEPKSELSRAAARASHGRIAKRLDVAKIPSTEDVFQRYFTSANPFLEDTMNIREQLIATSLPILIISGDHDISFAVENWFPLVRKMPSAQIIILPQTGHAPQHQFPQLIAGYIKTFIDNN
jgi:pimeloyl-ACP methyl ester carboxylesterase